MDGQRVDQKDVQKAKDIFGGRLTNDCLVEKFGYADGVARVDLSYGFLKTWILSVDSKFFQQIFNFFLNSLEFKFNVFIFLFWIMYLKIDQKYDRWARLAKLWYSVDSPRARAASKSHFAQYNGEFTDIFFRNSFRMKFLRKEIVEKFNKKS